MVNIGELFSIRKEISPRLRLALAFLSWTIVVLVWIGLTHWEILPPFSLPKPMGVIRAFGKLWTEYDLLGNVVESWWRIAQAFFWCAVVAIPLGVLMASFRWLFELINPVAAPMRAMPLTAFLPAFIADAGAGGFQAVNGREVSGATGGYPITATGDVGIGNPFIGGGGPRGIQLAAVFRF